MPVEITLVCSDCHEPCETVLDGRCAWCAYAANPDLPPGEILAGARVALTTRRSPPRRELR